MRTTITTIHCLPTSTQRHRVLAYSLLRAGVLPTGCCLTSALSEDVWIGRSVVNDGGYEARSDRRGRQAWHSSQDRRETSHGSRATKGEIHKSDSLQVTIKTNLLAELKHQAPN